MIVYIKENDFKHWLGQVNQWINNAGWQTSEHLFEKYPNQKGIYISHHIRIDNSELTLHHFWVYVTPKASTTETTEEIKTK